MYCWGNLIAYLPQHLKYWHGAAAADVLPDAQLVLPLILVAQMTGMPLGPIIEKAAGPRLTALLGAIMMGSGVYLAAGATSLTQFVLSYSLLFGLGVGIAYQMPFVTGGRWFPQKKGMVTGAIITGMGASAFIFNMIATKIINPDSLNPVAGAFPPEVTARWPALLRTLAVAYGSLAVVGALLQARKAPAAAAPTASLASMVFSRRFVRSWVMILCSAVSGLSIAGSYKTYGLKQSALSSDSFLTLVGSLAAIFGNAAGRFFWGSISDVAGFRKPYIALTLLQGSVMLLYRVLAKSRVAFTLATICMLFCMGGNFAMFPAETMRVYGASGASVYSVLFTAFGSAALLGPIVSKALMAKGGFELVFLVFGVLSYFSTGLALTY